MKKKNLSVKFGEVLGTVLLLLDLRLSVCACSLAAVARQSERHTVDGPGINNLAVDRLLPVEAGTFCSCLTLLPAESQ